MSGLFVTLIISTIMCASVHDCCFVQVRIIPIQLQRLLANLLLLDQQSASVDALTSSFGWSNNEVGGCAGSQTLTCLIF